MDYGRRQEFPDRGGEGNEIYLQTYVWRLKIFLVDFVE